jgi:hypothetical protein
MLTKAQKELFLTDKDPKSRLQAVSGDFKK